MKILIVGLVLWSSLCSAANITLDIINIDEVGTYNRIKFAYTGIQYEVPVVVEGGTWPCNFELTVAPSGMSINSSTGVISWDNPTETGSPHTVTVKVTDDESSTDTESYSLTVTTSTDRFLFVATSDDGTPTGAIADPYSAVSDFWGSDHSNKFIIFRSGTYEIPHSPVRETRNNVQEIAIATTNPRVWLAYPGENVTIDHENTYSLGLHGGVDDIYFGELTHDNIDTYGLVVGGADYLGIYKNNFTDYTYDTGSNAAYINFINANIANYIWIWGSDIGVTGSTITKSGLGAEVYDAAHIVFHGNTFHNTYYGLNLKDDVSYATVRLNTFSDFTSLGVYSQGYQQSTGCIYLDFSFNFITGGFGLYGESGVRGEQWWYRNTVVEDDGARGYWRSVVSGDGPIDIYDNVIVSEAADAGLTTCNDCYRYGMQWRYSDTSYSTVFTISDNLVVTDADGAVNSSGELQGSYAATYLGVAGWETSDSQSSSSSGACSGMFSGAF